MSPVGKVCDRCRSITGCSCVSVRRSERRGRLIERIYDSQRWRVSTRPAVLERDGYRCVVCGEGSTANDPLTVAHRFPTQALLAAGADVFDPALSETKHRSCHASTPPKSMSKSKRRQRSSAKQTDVAATRALRAGGSPRDGLVSAGACSSTPAEQPRGGSPEGGATLSRPRAAPRAKRPTRPLAVAAT